MKKIFYILSFSILFISCSNNDKAISEFCNCVEHNLNNNTKVSTYILPKQFSSINSHCYDSIINKKYKIKNEEFNKILNENKDVKNILKKEMDLISTNINKILVNNKFSKVYDAWSFHEKERLSIFYFDGSMFKEDVSFPFGKTKIKTGLYEIIIDNNWNPFIKLKYDNGRKKTYAFKFDNEKKKFYLDGDVIHWQVEKN